MSNELAMRGERGVVYRPQYPVGQRSIRETVTIRDSEILFRNFAGKPGPFNKEGERSFGVKLDGELAEHFRDRGLNVKPLRKRDDEEEQLYYLPVAVSYRVRPPRIYMVTGDGDSIPLRKAMLAEDVIFMMDNLELSAAHMVLSISNYEVNGNRGKKAYLQSFFGHVMMDELETEYASVEDMVDDDTATHLEEDNIIDGEIVEEG